jgi:hypothetical protein
VIIKSEEVNDAWIRNTVHGISYLFDRLACSESVRTAQNMIRPAAAAFTVTVGHPNPKKG